MTGIVISIINFFVNTINQFFTFYFPLSDFVTEVVTQLPFYLDDAYKLLCMVNFLVPIPTIFLICTLSLSIDFALSALFAINWVIRRIVDAIP